MQVLTPVEIREVTFKQRKVDRVSKAHRFYNLMATLEVGDGLLITKAEWPLKNAPNPSNIPTRVYPKGAVYKVRTTREDDAWVVIRTK